MRTILRQDSPTLTVKTVDCYIRSIGFYSAETWVLLKIDQKCLESFKGGAREGRRTPVRSILRRKKYHIESRKEGIS